MTAVPATGTHANVAADTTVYGQWTPVATDPTLATTGANHTGPAWLAVVLLGARNPRVPRAPLTA